MVDAKASSQFTLKAPVSRFVLRVFFFMHPTYRRCLTGVYNRLDPQNSNPDYMLDFVF